MTMLTPMILLFQSKSKRRIKVVNRRGRNLISKRVQKINKCKTVTKTSSTLLEFWRIKAQRVGLIRMAVATGLRIKISRLRRFSRPIWSHLRCIRRGIRRWTKNWWPKLRTNNFQCNRSHQWIILGVRAPLKLVRRRISWVRHLIVRIIKSKKESKVKTITPNNFLLQITRPSKKMSTMEVP